jgi:hypothetical protein
MALAMKDLASSGIPRSTLRQWDTNRDRAASATTRQEKTIEAADVYRSIETKASGLIRDALDCLTAAQVAADPRYLTALNTVAGTATDKRQLLTNKPTERVELTTLTTDEAIAAARQLRVLEGGKRKASV